MPPELVTLLSVLVTFAGAAAVFTRANAAEKAVFMKMVQDQNAEVAALKAEQAALRKNYEYEVRRGNRLDDEVKRLQKELAEVRAELAEVKRQRDERTAQVQDLERRLAEIEKPTSK